MARLLRIDQEDMLHHVPSRGNERRAIFRDDRERADHDAAVFQHLMNSDE